MAPVLFGAVCFRAHPRDVDDEEQLARLNEDLLNSVNKRRDMFLSHTTLGRKSHSSHGHWSLAHRRETRTKSLGSHPAGAEKHSFVEAVLKMSRKGAK